MAIVPAIVVHGGAGQITRVEACQRGVRAAVTAGLAMLVQADNDAGEANIRSERDDPSNSPPSTAQSAALAAVVAAVRILEDDPTFNAGTGAVLNFDGQAELDAAVATGDGRFGAVGALQNVQHPIDVAQLVMEESDHFLLVGSGAEKFARHHGIAPYDPITAERRARWQQQRDQLQAGGRPIEYWQRLSPASLNSPSFRQSPGPARPHYSTVGAVAVDRFGRVAAATSTGGISLKLPGRIGDTPIPGAGTFAAPEGAASATGHGEGIVRLNLTRLLIEQLAEQDAMRAARRVIDQAREARVEAGVIAVDRWGHVGYAYNTPGMAWAWAKGDQIEVFGS